MREIKFRYYNELAKRMIVLENNGLFDTGGFWQRTETDDYEAYELSFGGEIGSTKARSVRGDVYFHNDFARGIDKYELMQYTGLLDKNGKDVYEGDIVRFENADGNHDCETIYEPPRFVFKRKDGAYLQPALFNGIELINIASQQLEVIGNIYENLELLK